MSPKRVGWTRRSSTPFAKMLPGVSASWAVLGSTSTPAVAEYRRLSLNVARGRSHHQHRRDDHRPVTPPKDSEELPQVEAWVSSSGYGMRSGAPPRDGPAGQSYMGPKRGKCAVSGLRPSVAFSRWARSPSRNSANAHVAKMNRRTLKPWDGAGEGSYLVGGTEPAKRSGGGEDSSLRVRVRDPRHGWGTGESDIRGDDRPHIPHMLSSRSPRPNRG